MKQLTFNLSEGYSYTKNYTFNKPSDKEKYDKDLKNWMKNQGYRYTG